MYFQRERGEVSSIISILSLASLIIGTMVGVSAVRFSQRGTLPRAQQTNAIRVKTLYTEYDANANTTRIYGKLCFTYTPTQAETQTFTVSGIGIASVSSPMVRNAPAGVSAYLCSNNAFLDYSITASMTQAWKDSAMRELWDFTFQSDRQSVSCSMYDIQASSCRKYFASPTFYTNPVPTLVQCTDKINEESPCSNPVLPGNPTPGNNECCTGSVCTFVQTGSYCVRTQDFITSPTPSISTTPTTTPTPTVTPTATRTPTPSLTPTISLTPTVTPIGSTPSPAPEAPVTACSAVTVRLTDQTGNPIAGSGSVSYDSRGGVYTLPVVQIGRGGATFSWSTLTDANKPVDGAIMRYTVSATGYTGATVHEVIPGSCTKTIALTSLSSYPPTPPAPGIRIVRIITYHNSVTAKNTAITYTVAPRGGTSLGLPSEATYTAIPVTANCTSMLPKNCNQAMVHAHDFILNTSIALNVTLKVDQTTSQVVQANAGHALIFFTVDHENDNTPIITASSTDLSRSIDTLKSSADFDRSGQVNSADYVDYLKNSATNTQKYDVCSDGPLTVPDGVVNSIDLSCVLIGMQFP